MPGNNLNRFTNDGTSATYYNNGGNTYSEIDNWATIPNDRVQKISDNEAITSLITMLPSGNVDWDGARIYLYKGEKLTLTSN